MADHMDTYQHLALAVLRNALEDAMLRVPERPRNQGAWGRYRERHLARRFIFGRGGSARFWCHLAGFSRVALMRAAYRLHIEPDSTTGPQGRGPNRKVVRHVAGGRGLSRRRVVRRVVDDGALLPRTEPAEGV